MGWFDEQVKQRRKSDDNSFADSFSNVAASVMGSKVTTAFKDSKMQTKNAIDEILKFYHIKSVDIPNKIKDVNEQLEFLMRPHGIMHRSVNLGDSWYKDAYGPMLGVRKDDQSIVALIPDKLSGYKFADTKSGRITKITKKNKDIFEGEAIMFYHPFPLKKLDAKELIRYITRTLSGADFILAALSALVVTCIGMLIPAANKVLFSDVIASGNMKLLVSIGILLICVTISTLIFDSVKEMILARINTKLTVCVKSAAMMRILSLPADFFTDYSAGELNSRMQYIDYLCSMIISVVMNAVIVSVFSIIYVLQILTYAPELAKIAIIVMIIMAAFSIATAFIRMHISADIIENANKESGMSFSLINGIQKIRLSGSEKRAFSRWANLYAKEAALQYNPPLIVKLHNAITLGISLISTVVIYYAALNNEVSISDFYAFNAAYAMIIIAFTKLSDIAVIASDIKPIIDMLAPILNEVPEVSGDKPVISRLSGGIELNNITFRYSDNMPIILDNISLKIRAGQYVAIVGKSGCGKSTLLRLLLGFEKARKGAIYYDGKDINSIDLKSLRQKMGVVLQNGKLFSGDIYSNIAISSPGLSLDDAWNAAEIAGIADDIRNMPMGMNTLVLEGNQGMSGGQRQRLLIARAIASKPRILMFDEATSALDNITQKNVSQALSTLKCTRIVIAHRLSTIKQCDRVIVLDNGKIVEDGKYDELVENDGIFAELVKRQMVG